jgi:NADH-quinone oxidoreductase subunit H
MFAFIAITVFKVAGIILVLLIMVAYLTLTERKLLGRFQMRIGPNRAGPKGILQPIADGVKLLVKEEMSPEGASKFFFTIAPLFVMFPAMVIFAVIPFGTTWTIFGYEVDLVVADIHIGLLYVLAVSSLTIYGFILAGWASNNKFSLLGGLRASAQMISYELGMGLALLSVVLVAESLSLIKIVEAQGGLWFIILQPVAFLVFVVSAMAELNRAPFDLPEAESEIVAGYQTEYSSIRFATFYLGEYTSLITVSALTVTFFLGGWQGPFLPPVVWFLIKLVACLFFFIWVRATLPRVRYDQLMRFGWKVLIPVGFLNVMVTAALVVFRG